MVEIDKLCVGNNCARGKMGNKVNPDAPLNCINATKMKAVQGQQKKKQVAMVQKQTHFNIIDLFGNQANHLQAK